MASARGGGGRSSVRRHMWVLVVANLCLLIVVGIAGLLATVRAHESVHYLTKDVEPVARTNAAALQALTDSETYVWGYGISADSALLAQYRHSVDDFVRLRTELEAARSLDGEVGLLVDDFLLATDNWFAAYAEPRITGDVGPGTYDQDKFERGVRLFDEVRATNGAVAERLEQLSVDADELVHERVRRILAVFAATLALGALLSLLIGRRIGRRVTAPLRDLEETAHRLGVGEHDARAAVSGPREIMRVAAAVNAMADENQRARSVETRIVEQLRALDAVKSDFVSNVSHELRTPLTSILGYLELLEEQVDDHADEAEREMIAAAKRNVVRLGELIDDLLALTQSEAQRSELAPLDLAVLVRDVVTDLRVASSQQGVDVRLGLPGTPVPLLGDSGQIARVVTNLVSNAVKFSNGGSEVVVSVMADGDDAVLTVEDHGIGVPESEMDQLGSRFYRASNAVGMGITGTGLGLRIVQAIVENHHGNVDLRSDQGVGTTVWVRIPLAVTAGLGPVEEAGKTSASADPATPAGAMG